MTGPQPKRSPREIWSATPRERQRALIAFAVLAVIVVAYIVYAVIGNTSSDDDTTTPRGLTKTECTALFNARVGHDPRDNAFWADLVDCANNQLLPPGQNNPGHYAP